MNKESGKVAKKELTEDPLISVIIPVYNVEKYLKRCLDSVINQTYKNLEIILVDDGSTDDSGKMCDEYAKKDKRIKIVHKKNGGLSSARNCGIEKAKGEFLTFVDSDDEITANYVRFLFELIREFDVKMSIASYSVVTEHRVIDYSRGRKALTLTTEETLRRMLVEDGFTVSACSKMYSSDLFAKIRYPDSETFEDNATTHKLILMCSKIAYGDKSIYKYYIRKGSLTTKEFSTDRMDYISSVDEAMAEIMDVFSGLRNECEARRVRARLSVLKSMLVSPELNAEMEKEKDKIVKYLKDNYRKLYSNPAIDKKTKLSLFSLRISERLLKVGAKAYERFK